MANFKLDVDGDGIALITWDMADRSMNVITTGVIEELGALVDKVSADPAIKGVVVTSGKDAFCGGADLTMLEGMGAMFANLVRTKGEEAAAAFVFEESRKLSQVYRRIETCGKPWVCALNGTAMGGGFEFALACHHRIATDNPKTRLGLPEIKVGLFPGAGGTQRVARMIPPADALQFLLKGEQLKVDRAKAMKLIDAVAPQADLITAAKDWIKAGGKAKALWDTEGFRLPGGPVYSKAGMMTFPAANAIYRRETYDNYPAARAILQVVYEGLQVQFDTALRIESRWFAKILRSPEATAMIRSLFVSMQELNKGARRPANEPPTTLKKIGIVGAGFMVKSWTAEERQKLRDDVPRLGFKAEIRDRNVFALAQETLRLCSRGLARRKRFDRNGRDETRYLRPLEESIARGITPAEELLEKFHGEWNDSVEPIFNEYAY